jgi:2-dehydro-3-deoxyglucarate aldolase/4-hydroxy-2-oxoheptanedioate aldolase
MIKPFRKAIRTGQQLNGLLITMPSPEVVEILSNAGFDWLFFDLEHSVITPETLQNLLRGVPDSCFVAVRVPEATPTYVAKVLEAGAEGVIFPRISTAEQAEKAVSLCKYPPLGNRGVGVGRAQGYGTAFSEYLDVANERIACIVQIEDELGVKNASRISAVAGVDALFVGPYDLSMSMGIPGEVAHENIAKIIHRLPEVIAMEIGLGILTTDMEAAREYADLGYNLMACGIDTQLLGNGARQLLTEVEKATRK